MFTEGGRWPRDVSLPSRPSKVAHIRSLAMTESRLLKGACLVLALASTSLAEDVVADNELRDAMRQPADQKPAPAPKPDGFLSGWKGSVELGLNGSEGNSPSLNIRGAVTGERKSETMVTSGSLVYSRASEHYVVTKNRFEANARNDWIFEKGAPWRYFLTAKYEYDDFQEWLHRVTLGNGIGYAFIENDKTFLLGRAGFGVSREFVGGANRWVPQGILGADFR